MTTHNGTYGSVAIAAVRTYKRDPVAGPLEAWQKAVQEVFPDSASMREKSCPRSTFLGLCEAGLVRGIPPGKYTRSKLNKAYALKAVILLRSSPSLASNPLALWAEVMANEPKSTNGQAVVVIALWEADMLAAPDRS